MIRIYPVAKALYPRHVFRISRASRAQVLNVFLAAEQDGVIGYGEASPNAYFREDASDVWMRLAGLADFFLRHSLRTSEDIARIWEELRPILAPSRAALCAVDIALWDLFARLGGPQRHRRRLRDRGASRSHLGHLGTLPGGRMAGTHRRGRGIPRPQAEAGCRRGLRRGPGGQGAEPGGCPRGRQLRLGRPGRGRAFLPAGRPGGGVHRAAVAARRRPSHAGAAQGLPPPDFRRRKLRGSRGRGRPPGPLHGLQHQAGEMRRHHPRSAHAGHGGAAGPQDHDWLHAGKQPAHFRRSLVAAQRADYADLDGSWLLRDDPFEGLSIRGGCLHPPSGPGLGVRPASRYN